MGSNPTEVDGFFQDVKILSTSPPGGTLSWGSWIWDFRLDPYEEMDGKFYVDHNGSLRTINWKDDDDDDDNDDDDDDI